MLPRLELSATSGTVQQQFSQHNARADVFPVRLPTHNGTQYYNQHATPTETSKTVPHR
jgi:hypothetical protein